MAGISNCFGRLKWSILCLYVLLTSCVSVSTMQDGRVLGKGNTEVSGDLIFGKIGNVSEDSFYNFVDGFVLPNVRVRKGMKKNIDVYGSVNPLALNLTIGTKLQVLGDGFSPWASSIGAEVGGGGLSSYGSIHYNIGVFSFNSLHLSEKTAIFLNLNYTFLDDYRYKINIKHNLYGYNLGLLYGKKHKIGIEISQFANNKVSFRSLPILSLGCAFVFE